MRIRSLALVFLCAAAPSTAERTAYGYDVFGRLVGNSATDGPAGGFRTDTYFDQADNRTTVYARNVILNLERNQSISSADGRFRLSMQADGNFVLYKGSVPLWSTQTNSSGAVRAAMQGDGHLVVYRPDNSAAWASGTGGNFGAYLVLQDDGNLVIYDISRRPIWATNTGGH